MANMLKTLMEAPNGVSTAFVDETLYKINVDGYFEINTEHVAQLKSHGFYPVNVDLKSKAKKKTDA
jgi:hypothetical protein